MEQRERYVEKMQQKPETADEGAAAGIAADGDNGGQEEVTWVWREQQHEFELVPPASDPWQQPEQQQQPGAEQ